MTDVGTTIAAWRRLWLWLVVFGLVLAVIGAASLAGKRRFVAGAGRAEGVVVNVVRQEDAYAAVVRFRTGDGQTVEFTADETAGDRSYFRIGQNRRVLYDPDRPQNAQLDTWVSRWGYESVLLGLGILIVLLGALNRIRRPGPHAVVLPQRLEDGERVRVATFARTGPSVLLLWAAPATAGLLLIAADRIGAWLGVAALGVLLLAIPAVAIAWRPVRVVLTDQRLLVFRGRTGPGAPLLVVPRGSVAVSGRHQGFSIWGVTEFTVAPESASRPLRLSFWPSAAGAAAQPPALGAAIYAALTPDRRGSGRPGRAI